MIRRAWPLVLLVLAACGAPPELDADFTPIGDFRLGYNIVVANDVQKGPTSRNATEEELTDAVRAAMEARIGRYDGDGLYHIGLRIEAYVLGRAGVPLIYTPRSVMLIAMNIWDDATQEKLNEEPIRITAFDGEAGPLVGTGIAKTGSEQLAGLAFDAAREIEELLEENAQTWFAPKPGRDRVRFTRDPATGRQLEVTEDETNLGASADAALDALDRGASPEEAAATADATN